MLFITEESTPCNQPEGVTMDNGIQTQALFIPRLPEGFAQIKWEIDTCLRYSVVYYLFLLAIGERCIAIACAN